MGGTPFARLAELGEQLEQTSSRLELTRLVARFLGELEAPEVPPAVRMTIGQVFPEGDSRTLTVGWRTLMQAVDTLVDAAPVVRQAWSAQAVDGGEYVRLLLEGARTVGPKPPPLTILEVFHTLEAMAAARGPGSNTRKRALLVGLLARAPAVEAKFLTKVIYAEMRHGVNEGIMLEAIARASGVEPALVRRANQHLGDLGELARIALSEGQAGLHRVSVRVFQPVKPMLAQPVESLEEAYQRHEGRLALEYKLDGVRVQIHRQGDQVRIYSRNLEDVTDSMPELVAEVQAGLKASAAILDGEAIAVDAQGRPLPFQHVMRRFRRKHNVANTARDVGVQLYLFDLLHLDGQSLMEESSVERWSALQSVAAGLRLVRRLVPKTLDEGKAFADEAYRDGHEGVMAKRLDSPYTPGVRGNAWLKLKHALSLDLVVVAADWGYGRRHGWLSNYHLAARDEQTGGFAVVGKTFKGLTDQEIRDMTTRLLDLELGRQGGTVLVQPRLVVEVLFNEIQESEQYPEGLALRFARIICLRDDKAATEADTLQTVRALFEQQFERKGRLEPQSSTEERSKCYTNS